MSKRNPIEITFYFNTIEEAIATLGSLVQKAAPVANLDKPAQPLVIETPVVKPRKPRADAGQKRGPYKNVEAPVTADAAVTTDGTTDPGKAEDAATPKSTTPDPLAASTPETAAEQPAKSVVGPSADQAAVPGTGKVVEQAATLMPTPADSAAAPTEAELQVAINKVVSAKGLMAAVAALDSFGVKRGRDLKPEDRAAFIQKAEELAQ